MQICTIGEKCYWDSREGGLIPCIVTDIKVITHDITLTGQSTGYHITIKITAKNNALYKNGEILTVYGLHIIPRRFYHKTGLFTFVVYPDYIWSKG